MNNSSYSKSFYNILYYMQFANFRNTRVFFMFWCNCCKTSCSVSGTLFFAMPEVRMSYCIYNSIQSYENINYFSDKELHQPMCELELGVKGYQCRLNQTNVKTINRRKLSLRKNGKEAKDCQGRGNVTH